MYVPVVGRDKHTYCILNNIFVAFYAEEIIVLHSCFLSVEHDLEYARRPTNNVRSFLSNSVFS